MTINKADKANLVSSFIVAFTGTSGAVDAACIKYAMYDRSQRLSLFEVQWFQPLFQCFEYYSGMHFNGSDMQRAADDPDFSTRLPRRHPIRTMFSERPTLTPADYETARERFSVSSLRVGDLGDFCRIDCTYANGSHRSEVLPNYIAMYLCGSLKACRDMAGLMTSQASGTA